MKKFMVELSGIVDFNKKTILTVTWYYWIVFGVIAYIAYYLLTYYNNNIQPIIGFEPGSGAGYWFYGTLVVLGMYLFVAIVGGKFGTGK